MPHDSHDTWKWQGSVKVSCCAVSSQVDIEEALNIEALEDACCIYSMCHATVEVQVNINFKMGRSCRVRVPIIFLI